AVNNRLLLPLLLMAAPLVGIWLESLRSRWPTAGLASIWVLGCLPWLVALQGRSVLGEGGVLTASREDLLYARAPTLRAPLNQMAVVLRERGVRRLGVIATESEY